MSYSSINRVVLVGRLTKDPELGVLPSGQSVCDLRLACNGSRRDAEGGYRERPNYFDVSAFGVQAEVVSRFLKKGSALAVDGRLEWREWETTEQQKRQAVKVVAESVQFLERRSTSPDAAALGTLDGNGDGDGEDAAPGDGELVDDAAGREVELVF